MRRKAVDSVEPKVEDAVDIRRYSLSDLSESARLKRSGKFKRARGHPDVIHLLWRRRQGAKGRIKDLPIELPYGM